MGGIDKFLDGLEETFAYVREREGGDSVCGLCEYDGAYIGESGDWCNECPGFNRDDCFKLSDKTRKKWTEEIIEALTRVQPEKETPKRVLWNGWKGMRDTRYKCPNCKKPVRNTDIYCHRCGQKLMFPNISFTPYVEGQKQELIVRWDDEEEKE